MANELTSEVIARLDHLEATALKSAPPARYEIERAAKEAASQAIAPLTELIEKQSAALAAMESRLKQYERAKFPKLPNVAKTVAAALEPVADEILSIERNLKDDIKSAAARSSANALEARNAATGTVLASETALKAIAAHFAYGEK